MMGHFIIKYDFFKNYMELKAEPEMKTHLHHERIYFWEKMIWQNKQAMVEKDQLYKLSTQFLLDTINNV